MLRNLRRISPSNPIRSSNILTGSGCYEFLESDQMTRRIISTGGTPSCAIFKCKNDRSLLLLMLRSSHLGYLPHYPPGSLTLVMGIVPDSLRFLTDPEIVQLGGDLNSVVTSTRRSFELIEPWFKARSSYDDEFVNSVVNTVTIQAGEYHSAISDSIHVARDGYRFAEDAMNVYARIMSGTDTVEDIAMFLSDMLELANRGHAKSLAVSEVFRTTRSELLQVARKIPTHVFNVMAHRSTSAPSSNIKQAPFIDYADSVNRQNSGGVEIRMLTGNVTSKSYPQVVDQLIRISSDIEQLVHCVGAFVNWWSGMATKLFCLQRVVPQIRPDGSNPIRTRDVGRRWLEIRDQYEVYQSRIAEIQDQYQHLSISFSAHKTSEDKGGSLHMYPGSPPDDINLDRIAKSARQSFAILDLWRNTKSFDHELVEDMVSRMIQQGPSYYLAINKSAWTAQQGCIFASDAITFCDRLILGRDTLEALQRGLQDVMQIAREAHAGSVAMIVQFRNVRTELFKITKDPIYQPVEVSDQQEQAESTVRVREAKMPDKSCNVPAPEVIKTPLSQFEHATADLTDLIQHVGGFVDWWAEVNTILVNLKMVLPQIKVNGTNPFRTETVKERWIQVYQNYVSYQSQIAETEDYYKDRTETASLLSNKSMSRRLLPQFRLPKQRKEKNISQENFAPESISDGRSQTGAKEPDDVDYYPEPDRTTIEMVQHIQEVTALSLDLQTAISDHFPAKIAHERVDGVRQIRFMLCTNWKRHEVFFRLCQTYSGKYISHSRNAADNQTGDDTLNPPNTALIKMARKSLKQVLQMRADHRTVVAELDDQAKKMPADVRGSDLPGRSQGSNTRKRAAQALQGVRVALQEISASLRDLDIFWRHHISMLEKAADSQCSNFSSSDYIDIWIRFEKVLPTSISSVIDAAQDEASDPLPAVVSSHKGRREKILGTLISALTPEISGGSYGSAF